MGTQIRSTEHLQKAVDFVHGGALGRCLVAKAWDYHVRVALGCTNQENLEAIRASVEATEIGRAHV